MSTYTHMKGFPATLTPQFPFWGGVLNLAAFVFIGFMLGALNAAKNAPEAQPTFAVQVP